MVRGSSVREDHELGIREESSFFGRESARMFECVHLPREASTAGVVICSSIHAELLSNYRPEVLLARALASRGIAVQRFHYVGSGNSDGDADSMTFDSMCSDTRDAVDHFLGRTGVERLGFFGARFAAPVALSIAQEHGAAPVALWEPSLDFSKYFKEIVRFQLIREMRVGDGAGSPRRDRKEGPTGGGGPALESLRNEGSAEVLGYSISKALYDSAAHLELDRVLGGIPRPVLLVQLNKKTELKASHRKLAGAMEERSWPVTTHAFPDEPVWWLLKAPVKRLEDLVGLTADHLVRHLTGGEPR